MQSDSGQRYIIYCNDIPGLEVPPRGEMSVQTRGVSVTIIHI